MKRYLLITTIVFTSILALAQGKITIRGKITNPTAKNLKLSMPVRYGKGADTLSIPIDKDGTFNTTFYREHAGFGSLNNETRLWFSPGDTISLHFDARDYSKTIAFEGNSAPENRCLLAYDRKFNTKEARMNFIMKLNGTIATKLNLHDSLRRENLSFIKDLNLNNQPSLLFTKYMNNYIEYSSLTAKLNLLRELDAPEFIFTAPINNEQAITNPYYLDFIDKYISAKLITSVNAGVKNQTSVMIYTYYSLPEKLFQSASVIEIAKARVVYQIFRSFGSSEALKIYSLFEEQYPASKEIKFLNELRKTEVKLSPEIEAPQFNLPQSDGKMISLSQFRGKVVYLNFWASWCNPCIAQVPAEKALKEEYKDVIILNISIDTDEAQWKKALLAHEIKGINLLSKDWTSAVAKQYGVLSIPRYVIIGKNGDIINANAPRPSDIEAIKPIFEAALKER